MLSQASFETQIEVVSTRLACVSGIKNVRFRQSNETKHESSEITFIIETTPEIQRETLITWSPNYQEPLLYFRTLIVEHDQEGQVEIWRRSYDTRYVPMTHPEYSITLTQLSSGNWWFVHPCDTSEILQNSSEGEYLANWCSIFLSLLVPLSVNEFC